MSISENNQGFNPESAEEVTNNLISQEQVTDDDLAVEASSSGLESPDVTDEDIDEILVPADFTGMIAVATETDTVEIRKPLPMEFNRTSEKLEPCKVFLVKAKMGRFFVLHPKLYARYSREAREYYLIPAIDLAGSVFLWPIRRPGAGEKLDEWNKKALKAADLAKRKWIRILANKALTTYDVEFPEDSLPEPEWPKDIGNTRQLLKVAFSEIIIKDEDHPVLQRIRGKIV
jgi:hypothetical protein